MSFSYEPFGIRLRSSVPLHWLGAARGAASSVDGVDLTVDVRARAATPSQMADGDAIYHSPWLVEGVPLLSIVRTPLGVVVRYVDGDAYLLESDVITVYSADSGRYALMQSRLLSAVMAYWLEMRGVTMLHASSAKLGAGAVAFVADSGTGKSTMAAHLTASGVPLIGDDLLACSAHGTGVIAWPSFPSLRLWPHQAQHFFGSTDGMETATSLETKLRLDVGPGGYGRFCADAQPLLGIYVLKRVEEAESDVEIVPIGTAAEKVRSLTQHSFVRRLVSASGMSATRFGVLAGLVERVPVYRLVYRSGLDNLSAVYDALHEQAAKDEVKADAM